MQIKYDITKEELDDFLKKQEQSRFLQSWEWGELQAESGHKLFRFGAIENYKLVAVLTLIKIKTACGLSYFYAPKGPVFDSALPLGNFISLFVEIEKIAQKENCIFLRFEPESQAEIAQLETGLVKTIDVQPSKTLLLDVEKAEEELLKNMHPKTRYNIRLSERKGVEIRPIAPADMEAFENFWKIMQETKARDKFRLHEKAHYRKMLKIDFIKLLGAYKENKLIAANILALFGDTATYVHGASSDNDRNTMATYLLQWESIRLAKAQNCKYYDFNGINEDKWPGVTRFKKGFGGKELACLGTYDLVFFRGKYKAYNLLRKARRMLG